jgi:hypothetical protein
MPVSRKEGWKIALAVPGAEEVLWFNKPAVFLHGQFLTKVHDKEEAMTFRVSSMEMRDMMLEAEPRLFYITDHYKKFPYLLARLARLDKATLKDLLSARLLQIEAKAKKKRAAPKPVKKKLAGKKKR